MAASLTVTSPPISPLTPKTPTFNFTVPKPEKTKMAPWEGLLMGDPGPDYDQRENRKSLVRFILEPGKRDGKGRKMASWRDNQVLCFHPDDEEEMMQAEEAGKTEAVRLAEVKDGRMKVDDDVKAKKATRRGMDEDAMCWESSTVKERNDSKIEMVETSFGADEAWTTSRVILS